MELGVAFDASQNFAAKKENVKSSIRKTQEIYIYLRRDYFVKLKYFSDEAEGHLEMDPVFAIRGLLSFVAFSEWTTALRCLWPLAEEQSYVNARLFGNIKLEAEAERTLCHTYGLFSALVGLIIIHAAVYAHYR